MILISFWTAVTFCAFFTYTPQFVQDVFSLNAAAGGYLAITVLTATTYLAGGVAREQICMYFCPYARFQGVMYEPDTLAVSYDARRGEGELGRVAPKAGLKTHEERQAAGHGDCIDCGFCVQVCPTGIDIRKGLQYECIGCGACIDVCDTVMDKMGYPRGLVRYATQNALSNRWTSREMWRRVMRPRVLIYTGILVSLTLGLFISLSLRTPLKVDVVRDRASLARITEVGTLENVYRLQLMNATEQAQTYRLSVSGLDRLEIKTATEIEVAPAQARWVIVRADIPYGSAPQGSHKIIFDIQAANGKDRVTEKSVFMVPR